MRKKKKVFGVNKTIVDVVAGKKRERDRMKVGKIEAHRYVGLQKNLLEIVDIKSASRCDV